jgi:hypothetical protein
MSASLRTKKSGVQISLGGQINKIRRTKMIPKLIKYIFHFIFGGCNHQWDKWKETPVKVSVLNVFNRRENIWYNSIVLKRTCLKCGKIKRREI